MSSTALDQLRSAQNLALVWKEYWRTHKNSAPGVDNLTPQQFNDNLKRNLRSLRSELCDGYIYSALRGIPVPKKDPTKKRLICVPTIRDRLVQRAILRFIERRASQLGIANDVSFGFIRAPTGAKRGVNAARSVAVRRREQRPWVFKTDIESFFDSIPREELVAKFERAFRLQSLHPLVRGAVNSEIDTADPVVRRVTRDNGIRPGRGLRQGMPLSPILSNFVLRDFDETFSTHGYSLIRYADDLIVLASSQDECLKIRDLAIFELQKIGLKLNDAKTEIRSPGDPVEFLGMELRPKPGTSKYALEISDHQLREIKREFAQYHDWQLCVSQKLDISKLFSRLLRMKGGYREAYGVAENYKDLSMRLDQWAETCALKIYSSIFGSRSVRNLTAKEKAFLMIPSAA